MLHMAVVPGKEGALQGLGSANMTCTGGSGKNEHPRLAAQRREVGHSTFTGRRSQCGGLTMAGGELLQDGPREVLKFAEVRQVFLEFVIQPLSVLRAKLIAQDHVAKLYRMRQQSFFLKFLKSLGRIVVIHEFPPRVASG